MFLSLMSRYTEEVGHGWPLLIRSLMRVPLLGVAWSRAQFRPAHNSFIGLTWLLSLCLDLSVYQGRLLAIHLVWYKLSAKNCYICARDQEGYLISDLMSKGQWCPTSSDLYTFTPYITCSVRWSVKTSYIEITLLANTNANRLEAV